MNRVKNVLIRPKRVITITSLTEVCTRTPAFAAGFARGIYHPIIRLDYDPYLLDGTPSAVFSDYRAGYWAGAEWAVRFCTERAGYMYHAEVARITAPDGTTI